MAQNPELIKPSPVTTLEPGDVIPAGVNHQQIGAVQDRDVLRMESCLRPPLIMKIPTPEACAWH
jgi:hypothetical protein